MSKSIPAIALEEHVSFACLGDQTPFYKDTWKSFPEWLDNLRDHEERRLAHMDAGNVAIQVLSHIPGVGASNSAGCQAANDEMARVVQKHPDRLRGFAVLPMADPEEATRELKRAVNELHLCGALVDNHLEDMTHYDDERFWPVFAMAEHLNVPLYLHPAPPTKEVIEQRFSGNYSVDVAVGLATAAWGWHEDVGLHILKLFAAGLFERHPNIKILVGHMGELVPGMIDRVERMGYLKKNPATWQKGIRKVWAENIWVTTSGVYSVNPMATLMRVSPVDHILFSIDYPFQSNVRGREFLDELAESGMVTSDELKMIAHGNATKLLGIKLQSN